MKKDVLNMVFFSSESLIYYTLNKSHLNSFILLVFPHVANLKYVANFTFLTLLLYVVTQDIENKNIICSMKH